MQRAAVFIGTLIGVGRDELIHQIAIGRVDLDTVEAGVQRVLRGLRIQRDQFLNLADAQRTRYRWLHQGAGAGVGFDKGLHLHRWYRGWCDRRRTIRLQRGVRHAAHMPQLREDDAAFGMHGIRHLAPAGDLLRTVDAGSPGITLAPRFDLRAFADHQAGARPLAIIQGHQVGRHIAGLCGALARQRRQHDAVFQDMPAQRGRRQQRSVVHHDSVNQAICLSSSAAASADEPGFWPVINRPSMTTYELQSAPCE